jgi:hypothetical protein
VWKSTRLGDGSFSSSAVSSDDAATGAHLPP